MSSSGEKPRCAADPVINPRHVTVIYNPVAGRLRGKGRSRLEHVRQILANSGYTVSLAGTTGPGTAGAIARQAILEGTELIVVAGGDGTLNEAANGIVNSAVPLAILPAGTANVVATELGLGSSLEEAAARISHCIARRIGIGRLDYANGSRYFLAMAGVGFDAGIVYRLSGRLKNRLGKAAYWLSGVAQAVQLYPEFTVQVGGTPQTPCSFALASRVRNYGGDFEIAQSITMLDDGFEVVLFRGRHALPYVKYVGGMVTRRLAGMSGVTFLRAASLTVLQPLNRKIHIQVDGEYAGCLPASIQFVPEALTLMVPPEYFPSHSPRGLQTEHTR